MSEPSFLTVDQVERLHENLIDRFGGSHGLRDRLLLEGAVLHPRNVYYYAQGDLFDVAAAYAFHISEAQAFLDGNKRTAIAAALVFLEGNGVVVPSETDRLYEAMIAMVEKRMGKVQLAELLRELATRLKD
jgi:death-on-curing protein